MKALTFYFFCVLLLDKRIHMWYDLCGQIRHAKLKGVQLQLRFRNKKRGDYSPSSNSTSFHAFIASINSSSSSAPPAGTRTASFGSFGSLKMFIIPPQIKKIGISLSRYNYYIIFFIFCQFLEAGAPKKGDFSPICSLVLKFRVRFGSR